jgi:uncharacterized protein YbjT (DUF2867 family)
VHVSHAFIQPIYSDDVASVLADVAPEKPVNGTIEIAGPERFHFDELIRRFLSITNDPRQVITDPHARYFGSELEEQSLVPAPGDSVRLGTVRFEDWINQAVARK